MTHLNASLLLKESSSSKHNNNISFNNNDQAQLQSLLKDYKDVLPDDLPPGLPPERTITHGIDLNPW